jgi:glycosyltransferase involved in cell wall biosynthesis
MAAHGADGGDRPRAARLVSVVVPTRDRPELLAQALASVRALEGPDLTFEILVGDNGTHPQTQAVALAHGARYVKADRSGAAAARNVALRAASAEFVAFLDDDDLWTHAHVRDHLALLDADPNLIAVVGQAVCTDEARRPTGEPWPWDLPADGHVFQPMLSGYFPQIGATVVRTGVREAFGPFDESLFADQDWDWHLRMARRNRFGFVKKPCVLFRQRPAAAHDALQLRRVGFTRRVFFRHALGADGPRWPPTRLLRSYSKCLGVYASYFVEAAVEHAEAGDKLAAARSIARAFQASPLAAGHSLVRDLSFRRAVRSLVLPREPHPAERSHRPPAR